MNHSTRYMGLSIKAFLISGILSLLFISLLEMGLSFVPLNREESIYDILAPQNELLWKVKSRYNKVFFNAPTTTNENGFRYPDISHCKENERILGIFGASPSFGWGVHEHETYGSLLEKKLKEMKKNICVVNYSQIGYSSTQGRYLIQKIIEQTKIDIAIVSYFVNDIDFIRFYKENLKSDQDVISESVMPDDSYLLQLSQWVNGSNLYRLLARLRKKQFDINDANKNQWPGQQRVTLGEFIENYHSILTVLTNLGIKVLVVKPHIAIPLLASRCEEDPKCLYKLNVRLENYLNDKSFENFLWLHKALGQQSLLSIPKYTKALKEVTSSRGIEMINFSDEMSLHEKKYYDDVNVDGVHPNQEGHKLMANKIVPILSFF